MDHSLNRKGPAVWGHLFSITKKHSKLEQRTSRTSDAHFKYLTSPSRLPTDFPNSPSLNLSSFSFSHTAFLSDSPISVTGTPHSLSRLHLQRWSSWTQLSPFLQYLSPTDSTYAMPFIVTSALQACHISSGQLCFLECSSTSKQVRLNTVPTDFIQSYTDSTPRLVC